MDRIGTDGRGKDMTTRLEAWGIIQRGGRYEAPELWTTHLTGKAFGHPGFPDGEQIITSAITGGDVVKHIVKCKSREYIVGEPDDAYEKLFPGAKERLFKSIESMHTPDVDSVEKTIINRE